MQREIKFRGKCLNDGVWVYGDLLQYDAGSACEIVDQMINFQQRWVDPASIGQYTGLRDKDGKEIWEGDVVRLMGGDYSVCDDWDADDPRWGDPLPIIEVNRDVVTMDRFPVYWLVNESFGYEGEDLQDADKYEVIGSIHDQPELIEAK